MLKPHYPVVVISDLHLGTYGCQARELLNFLKSFTTDHLILNGDVIDIWQFKKRYFPKSHMEVLRYLLKISTRDTQITYITGNHDELLRKFSPGDFGNIQLVDKLVLKLPDGKKAWIFHGDVFDASIQHSKWLAKLGGWGYDFLILLNSVVNYILKLCGKPKYSLSKKIKSSVKRAVKHISDFETTAAELAIDQGYDFVICGHIHEPSIRDVELRNGSTRYLNSGDWVENLTALLYDRGRWEIYRHQTSTESKAINTVEEQEDSLIESTMGTATRVGL